MEPKYLLLVKVPKGIVVRDTPRPESQGGRAVRSVAVGSALYAYNILPVEGVPYARLVPQNPQRHEWVRVREADGSQEYVEVIEIDSPKDDVLVNAITLLTNAVTMLATEIRLGRK